MYAAGWYPDPTGRFEHRYHNGTTWTADVAADGRRFVDPLVASRGVGRPRPASASSPNGLATGGMVCGIVGLAISWIPFLTFAGVVTSIVGLILAIVGLRRTRPDGNRRASAITGIVTGGAGILMSGFGIWLTFAITRAVDAYESPQPNESELTSCRAVGRDVVAAGRVSNLGDDAQTYTVIVELERGPGRSRVQRAIVEDLAPGAEATFTVDADLGAVVVEPTCDIRSVRGPPPFGLDIDLD